MFVIACLIGEEHTTRLIGLVDSEGQVAMTENINTRHYWEQRFSSGDWESKQGRWQTENFAKGQTPYLELDRDFAGTLLDFGCGLGDAIPIYRKNFPRAALIGVDISQSAIDDARKNYGELAEFRQGEYYSLPMVDIIIASNVLEHLSNDTEIAAHLLSKCRSLYIVVPYKEYPLCAEHVNSYTKTSFSTLGEHTYRVFPCAGWTPMGLKNLWYQIYFKNIFRFLLGRPIRRRNMQIIFKFHNPHLVPQDIIKQSG